MLVLLELLVLLGMEWPELLGSLLLLLETGGDWSYWCYWSCCGGCCCYWSELLEALVLLGVTGGHWCYWGRGRRCRS